MEKIENWLDSRIGLNFRTGLGRMEQAIRLLGHPEKAYPTIHVTGTNGKTTTSNLIGHTLKVCNKNFINNFEGANMLDGIISTFAIQSKNNTKLEAKIEYFED